MFFQLRVYTAPINLTYLIICSLTIVNRREQKRAIQRNSAIVQQQKYSDFLAPQYWSVWLGIVAMWLIARLPYAAQMALGNILGAVIYRLAKSRRSVCEVNLKRCFPELSVIERQALVKKTFKSYAQGTVETAMAWVRPNQWFAKRVDFSGLEHLSAAAERGQGVLLVGAHFAMLDLAGALLGLKLDFDFVQRPHNNKLFNLFMTRSRERFMNTCVANKDTRGMLRVLKKGRVLWYAPDQDYGRKASVFVPFFGVSTATVTATSKLAAMAKAAVIPISYVRDNGRYKVTIHSPLDIPSGDEIQDAASFNSWLEGIVRKYPEQYLWLHKRFKTRPEGEAKFY